MIRDICYTFMQMPEQFTSPFSSFAKRIMTIGKACANIGVSNRLSVHEKSKVRVINLSVIAGTPFNFSFCIINFIGNKPLLATLNLALTLGALLVLVLHKQQRFFLASIVLICGGSLLFFVSSILYRNGSEIVILAFMIISVVIFDDRRKMIAVVLFNFILYAIVKAFLLTPIVFDTVPKGRVLFNSLLSLLSVTISLIYLRKEQERHEELIEKNLRDLARLNAEKEKLFSIIAHDLRSPIGQLKTLIDLVNEQYISIDTFKEITAKLSGEVDQLHGTMDNLLKWSISQSHGITVKPLPIPVPAAFDYAIGFFAQKASIKNIQLLRDEDIQVCVMADPDHLELVLRNLISNAIKYSRVNGMIRLRSYTIDEEVIIEVMDNGMGMTDETRASIFNTERFNSQEGTAREKGTGLGLKLCKEFVEENHGRIWVTSEEGKGSTFFVALPACY